MAESSSLTEEQAPSSAQSIKPRRPMVELLTLAAPTVAQMASYTVMQFIDTWMLARLGTTAPTAAANSGMMAFSVIGFGMGSLWIVNTLASQSFGRRDFHQCGRYLWQGVWFAIVYVIALLPAILLAHAMFTAFGHPRDVVPMEATFYRISLAGAIFKLLATAFGQFLLAIDRPRAVLWAAVFGVGVNVVAAWAMVLGHLGFHSMGVAGSAWATNIGTAFEMSFLIAAAVRPAVRHTYNVMDWRPRTQEMRSLLRFGLPSGLQWVMDILAWSLFTNVVIGVLGPAAMAANTFMMRYMVVSFMPAIGLSTAVTALVGRYIGAGQPDVAIRRTHLGFAVTATWQIGCGVLFFLGRHTLLKIFTDDPQILKVGALYMTFSAAYQFFDSLYITYNGALRGAGDTLVPATITGILNWGINVTGGYLVARFIPSLGFGGPWIIATIYGAILGFYIFSRFSRGRWKTIRIGHHEPIADPHAAAAPSNVPAPSVTI
jgi:MATE family multidrug resistance protein